MTNYGMKVTTATKLCLAANLLVVMGLLQLAVAQDPVREEQRSVCVGAGGLQNNRCESLASARSALAEISNESGQSDEFASRRSQIREDVNYLEAAGSYLSRASQADDLDFNAIATATGQIRRRAQRLRSQLVLASSEPSAVIKELELPSDRPELKLSIHTLSSLIAEVLRNPSVKGQVLDAIGSLKALSDLNAIVELGGRIRRQCELLSKGAP